MDKYITLVIFIGGMSLGSLAGRYHGQSEVFQQLLSDKIECTLDVNPITATQLK